MSKVILLKRKILEPGETLTADYIEQALRRIGGLDTNQSGITKNEKGEDEMPDLRITIRKLDQNLKESVGKIQKSERISKVDATDFLNQYADQERSVNPSLSQEAAFVKAMDECPRLADLAIG
jgi:hypothetical protein